MSRRDIIWKCCCNRGVITDTCRRKTLFDTDVDENEHCVYCGNHAFADFESNTGSWHVRLKSDRDVHRDLDVNIDSDYVKFEYECDAVDRVDLYGRWNGKPIRHGNY